MIARPKFALRQTAAMAIVVASITLGGLTGCGGGNDTVTPVNPPLIEAEATNGSKVMSWFAQIADSLYDVAEGMAAIAEGNVVAGFSEFTAAGLGLIGKLDSSESDDDQAKQLTEIDSKLDTVIVDVQSLATQVSTIEGKVDNLAAYTKNAAAMKTPMDTAQTWLDSYYTNPGYTAQSREWVRWYMAGCDLSKVGSCPSASNPASASRLALFRQTYMKNPAVQTMTRSTDNFPLWWAYSVVGDQTTGATTYSVSGTKASDIVTQIYQGLTNNMGQDTNGLISYMNYFMTQDSGHCSKDVTDPQCDLYNNVYLPLEAYFSLAIGRQSQLVMALAEANTVLAQEDQAAYGQAGTNQMAVFNKQLAVEVEAFLQAAEQIALYRAADGRTDWSNFAATDAGRLLARADFVAAQLAGKNYRTANTTPAWTDGYVNPPWPSNGIVGRVFYANGELLPTGTATRSVCTNANAKSCTNALTQIGENTASLRTISGVQQPYLLWKKSTVDAKGAVTLMTGTANTLWTVQRLTPVAASTLSVGASYQVNSTQPLTRAPATFRFDNYDENFASPPGPGTNSIIPFGSFSSVEGAIGHYGLMFDTDSFQVTADWPKIWDLYSNTYSASPVNPGSVSVSVTYKPFKANPLLGQTFLDKTIGRWSASAIVKVDTSNVSATSVKVNWPTTPSVDLSSSLTAFKPFGLGVQCGDDNYYSYIHFTQQVLDNKNNPLLSTTLADANCASAPFGHCQFQQNQSMQATVLTATASANLILQASFETDVVPLSICPASGSNTLRFSTPPKNIATWDIQAPMLTLIR